MLLCVQLLKRLDSGTAVNGCMAALVAGDLLVAPGAGASRADCLLPLYVPGERSLERHAWLADLLIAVLQRAQVYISLPLNACQQTPILDEVKG